jgi:hypothetical protein
MLTAALTVLALGAFAAPVQAAIPIQNVIAKPDNTVINRPANFRIHFELGGSEQIKDLTQQLPPTVSTNATQPECPEAMFDAGSPPNCPADTKVGTTKVDVTVASILPQTLNGTIYFLEGLKLGIFLDAPDPFDDQRQIVQLTVKPTGVESKIENFPTNATIGGSPGPSIRIDALDIVLQDTFFRNPGECTPATTHLFVTSYADPGTTTTAAAGYTPTGCHPPVRRCKKLRVTITGTPKSESLRGTTGRDVISGLGGRDTIRGLGGNDVICGGAGPDKIYGGRGADLLLGNAGNDRLFGGAGKDRVRGGPGRDVERP